MNCKALSIMPPWCDHIIWGQKRAENRNHRTNHRGIIAIHSSTTYDLAVPRLPLLDTLPPFEPEEMKGAIIGIAKLVSCLPAERAIVLYPEQRDWIRIVPGTWCWILANPQPLISPVKHRGYPWIFGVEIPDDLLPEAYRG